MIFDLSFLDLVFILIVLLSVILGIVRGFMKELFSMIFLVLSVILSIVFYTEAGEIFIGMFKDRSIANFMGFISIFAVVLIIGSIITYSLKKMIIIGPLRSVDRILGMVFGLFRGILIVSILLFGLVAFSVKDEVIEKSKFAPFLLKTINVVLDFIPADVKNII
ncbi:MAG: CvpA family protein [Acidobacteriota bacterium]